MTVNPRQSYKLKLSLSILTASLISFILIFVVSLRYASKEIKDSVSTIVESKLALATKALDDKLADIEIASDNLIGLVDSPIFGFDPTTGNELGKIYLESNPHVQGVCVGYKDGSIFNHKGPWCPYVMRKNGEFIVRDLATTKDFTQSEWYKVPAETRTSAWSEPFMESNGTIIVSYNVPLFDEQTDSLVSVVAVDQNLNELSDSLQMLSPYENSYLFLVDKEGRYIAHPDTSKVFASYAPAEIIDFINSGAEYYVDKTGEQDVYLFPSKIERTGWTVLLAIPRSAITTRSTRMMQMMLLFMLIGILLLLSGSGYVISRLTKPLETFADAARKFSHGDFDVDLPVIKDHNELYDLRAALVSMKSSLDIYIEQLEDTSAKKASIERELDIARNIQMAMIPKIFPPYPNHDNIDIFASLDPAQAVGGDLYDFILIEDKFFFCVGDVSGKGVPASLLMAITRTLFRNTASIDKTPADIAKTLNDAIAKENDMGLFVTMAIGSFDIVTGELELCNCGHNLPATNGLIADPETMTAEPKAPAHLINGLPTNIAIGVFPGFDYKQVTMNIKPGCWMVLYTDGVTEAENASQELYDESRLLSCLEAHASGASSETVVKSLVEDVAAFRGKAAQNDDITILCLRCERLGK